MGIINNDRVKQTADESPAMGKTQTHKVPTHEGSLLGSPTKAGETEGNMPADKEAQS